MAIDPKTLLATIRKLALSIPRFAPSFDDREIAEAWIEELQDLPPEAFGKACHQAVMSFDAFPSIRELRGLCGYAPVDKRDVIAQAAREAYNSITGGPLSNPLAREIYRLEKGSSLSSAWRDGQLREADLVHVRRRFETTGKEIWREAESGALQDASSILALANPPAQRPALPEPVKATEEGIQTPPPQLAAAPPPPRATVDDFQRIMRRQRGEP